MRVNVLKVSTLLEFQRRHSNAQRHFEKLINLLKYADWSEPADITRTINGNLIGGERVVFDLGANGQNAFRVICHYAFRPEKKVLLYVVWIGSHEEYNALSQSDKLSVWDFK